MRPRTAASRRQIYETASGLIERHYRRPLTLPLVARAIATSPRQLQRAFEQFGGSSFSEQLIERRLSVAAALLAEQRSLPVATVARLSGYRQAPHFSRAFRRRYGMAPAQFRAQGLLIAKGSSSR